MLPIRKSHPMMKIINNSLIDLPAPINISYWWNYGSILGLFLMIQTITGIFLSMHYTPNTEMAFMSLIHIMREVNWGWLLHTSHMNGASMFMLFMYIHMGRSIFYNSYYLKETWNIGVMIFITSMATAFMGYVLPWGQMSFWGATVITNIFSAIPYLGQLMVEWLWGGFAVSNPTLNRFFSLHFIMPMILIMLVILHFMFLHQTGSNNPLGVNPNADRIPFHHYFTMKDMLGYMIVMLLFMMTILFIPNLLSDPENFTEANPLITPTHIQPEWYFLWLYAILRSIPNKLGGVIALLAAILILFSLPMSMPPYISSSYNPMSQFLFFLMLSAWFILSWIGSCPVEPPFIMIGQLASIMYFLFFFLNPIMLKL